MKKVFIFLMLSSVICISAQAQLPKLNKESLASAANPGKLLTQFTNAIKPASFLSSWAGQKGGWIGKAQKISDAVSLAKNISSLAGFLKPGQFKTGFNVQNLLNTANTVKTMTDAAGLLKSFEGGLKPEAFLSSWAGQKNGWLKGLDLLK